MYFFDKGRYRLIILPESTDARVVTVIEPVKQPRRFKGHGPHKLPLAALVDHTWTEPEPGKERLPDQWKFELPADGDVSIELTGEMQADLVRTNPDGKTERVAFIPPARGWQGRLAAGSYRIDAACMRVNNRAAYRVAVRPHQLMMGMSRDVGMPSVVPVAIGQAGLVELSSFGGVDVKARLTTEEGTVIAENDDRPDDWNFHIATLLKPGMYRLHVDPVVPGQGICSVSVRIPKELNKTALSLPTNTKITLTDSVQLFPLTLPSAGELLIVSARAPENIGLAVEVVEQGGWRTIGSTSGRNARLDVPLREPLAPAKGRYRLRLWSMDQRDTVVELSALFVSPLQLTEEDLKEGIELSFVDGDRKSAAAAAVRIERGGLLRIPDEFRRMRWSAVALRPCGQPEEFLPVQPGFVWITGEAAARGVKAQRVSLGSGEDKAIQIRIHREKVLCDLAGEGRGPVLAIASSRVGRPGVEIFEQGSSEPVNIGRLVVGEHSALSVSLHPKKPVSMIWPAASLDGPFEAQFTQMSFPVPETASAKDGLHGSLEGKKARVYELPMGNKRIELSLGEGIVAAMADDGAVASVHWAEGNSFTEVFETDAARLFLLHTRDGEDRYAIDLAVLTPEATTRPLAVGEPFEQVMLNSGRLRLPIAAEKAPDVRRRTLHVRGAKKAIFMNKNGTVALGSDLELGERGGMLTIEHGPGPLLSWLDRPGEEAADLWATSEKPHRTSITVPTRLPLEGKHKAYRIDVAKPVMLHVRSAAPLATYLDRGEKTPDVEIHPQGVTLDAYLPRGAAELRLRSLGGATLSGQIALSISPVIPTDEGLGPEVLLAPGGARLFSFTVRQEAMIGVGVKADSDNVAVELLGSTGASLGKGVAQMLRLKPGVYLLKLQAPDDAVPVKARPALVGLRFPDTGPPPEEIRKYLFSQDEMPSAYSSRRVEERPSEPESDSRSQDNEGMAEGTEEMGDQESEGEE